MTVLAILFDIDGTLVDSNEGHVEAWRVAFDEAGHPQTPAAIRAQIGKGGDLLVPALLPDLPEAEGERIAERQGAVFKADHLAAVRPFADAAALVRRVRAGGRKVVLASSAKGEELDHYVDLLGIGDVLDATATSDDVEASKPEPDIFGTALARIGVAPEAAIAVGDTPYDVEAARRAGVATVAVASGPFDTATLERAGAVAVYRDVADLLARFDGSPLAR